MTPRQFLNSRTDEEVEKVAVAAGTTFRNFKTLCYNGKVGRKLAERLALASRGVMSELEILYPERYEK